jgi:hypothetical protein
MTKSSPVAPSAPTRVHSSEPEAPIAGPVSAPAGARLVVFVHVTLGVDVLRSMPQVNEFCAAVKKPETKAIFVASTAMFEYTVFAPSTRA